MSWHPSASRFWRRTRCTTVAVTALVTAGCSGDIASTRPQSVASILANPSRFEGRLVTVRGYVHLARGGDALYLHEDDYRWGIEANSLWLHMPHCANRAGEAVQQGYMTVVGNFTARLHGAADGWAGEIDNIKLCRLIEGVADDPRPRPTPQ